MSAGLVAALSGPRVAPRAEVGGFAPADTVSADWIARVTMEPIVAVVSPEERLESVTMETIRVVIPVDEEAEASPR